MFSLADLITPCSAPIPEQRKKLEQLQAALSTARAELVTAQDAFDDLGTPTAQKTLTKAQEAEREAVAYLERAQRNLAKAEKKAAEEHSRQLKLRVEQIRRELADNTTEEKLTAEEVKLLIAVARKRVERRDHNLARHRLEHEATSIMIELDGQDAASHGIVQSVEPNWVPVVEALHEEARREMVKGNGSTPLSDALLRLQILLSGGR